MKRVIFKPPAYQQYMQWVAEDKKTFDKIYKIIENATNEPFKGIGKPEPLKHSSKGVGRAE